MAADWTPMRNDLCDDPAVVTISMSLSITVEAVVGHLLRVWGWAGAHTVTGKCDGITLAHVDFIARRESFGAAMRLSGWLNVDENGFVTFPKWVRWNGKASKKRLKDAIRASRYRAKSVTRPSRYSVTNHAPTEQNSTDKKTPLKPPQGGASHSSHNGKAKRPRPLTAEQAVLASRGDQT